MKANSPTCASEKPHKMAVLGVCPEITNPMHEKNTFPKITIREIYKIGSAYLINMAGFTIMPTETKKTAPKKSLSGFKTCSIRFTRFVSAKITPMMKAPNADEKPEEVANKTIPRQRPTEIINNVSSFK